MLLEEGDMLYIPRGVIHFGESLKTEKVASHHLTVSTYQKYSMYDFLGELIPNAMENAFKKEEVLRRGVPLNYFDCAGTLQRE